MGRLRWTPITEEEWQIQREVLEAMPPEARNKKHKKPLYLMNPVKIRAYYEAQARSGRSPTECRIPKDKMSAGGSRGSRLGIPDGETKASMELKMSLVEQEIVRRMEELEETLPDGLIMNPYLSADKQKELGITINPMYYLQKMFLSGIMTPKEQIAILTKLTDFTHQKTTQKTENIISRPEEFLELLANDERVIDGTAEVIDDSEETEE